MVRSCARASRGNAGKLAASLITGEKIPEPSESTCFTPAGIVASRLPYRSNRDLSLVRPAHIFACAVKCKMLRPCAADISSPIISEEGTRDSGWIVGNPEAIQKRGPWELIATDDYRSTRQADTLCCARLQVSSWERLGKEVETTKRELIAQNQ